MKFIGCGEQNCRPGHNCGFDPEPSPQVCGVMDCPPEQDGQDRVFGEMRAFSDKEMDRFYCRHRDIGLQPAQKRNEVS